MRLITIILSVGITYCRTDFKKDQSTTNIQFPPKVPKALASSFVPVGHLRPLGWQRLPTAAVPKTVTTPDPRQFYAAYVNNHKPVVLLGGARDTPAMTTWTEDAYLKEKYGELTIHVVMKKEIRHLGPRKMLLRKFLREYEYENWHLTTSIPQPLMHELTIPVCLRCGLRKYLLESELWMSSGGTASTLHAHADHLLHCLLAGRKDFVIIHPQYKDELAFVQKTSHAGAGFSEIDTDRVNMFQHKGVAKVPWTYATLKPGDCIYIPAETEQHAVKR